MLPICSQSRRTRFLSNKEEVTNFIYYTRKPALTALQGNISRDIVSMQVAFWLPAPYLSFLKVLLAPFDLYGSLFSFHQFSRPEFQSGGLILSHQQFESSFLLVASLLQALLLAILSLGSIQSVPFPSYSYTKQAFMLHILLGLHIIDPPLSNHFYK